MPVRNTKVLVSLALAAGGVAVLIVAATTRTGYTTDYYRTPTEFLANASDYVSSAVRVNGKVVPGSIRRRPVSEVNGVPALDFVLGDSLNVLSVHYVGTDVPDAFRENADVVVEGIYTPDGNVQARQLLVKCPSKYEAAPASDRR